MSNYIVEEISRVNRIMEIIIKILLVTNPVATLVLWFLAFLKYYRVVTIITGFICLSTMIMVAISGIIFKKALGDHFSGSHIRTVAQLLLKFLRSGGMF